MRITRKHLIWAGAAMAVAAIGYLILRPDPIEVEWATVERGPLRVVIEADAQARSRARYAIAAPVTGRVERLSLKAGDTVRRGMIVARIAPAPLDPLAIEQTQSRVLAAAARLAQASAARTQAVRDAERARVVEAAGGLAAQQREYAELQARARDEEWRAASAEHRAALSALRSTRPGAATVVIRSPLMGRVLRVPEISERVTPAGTPLLELADPNDLEIVADLLSSDAARVRVGALAEIEGWGGDSVIAGRVRVIEPAASLHVSALGVDEQRVNIVIEPGEACDVLGDGYQVTARIVLWEGRDVISVPSSAVFREGNAWKLFLVEGERTRMREVSLGHRSDASVEVLGGVVAGDRVVLFPSDRVRDGIRVALR